MVNTNEWSGMIRSVIVETLSGNMIIDVWVRITRGERNEMVCIVTNHLSLSHSTE